MLRTIRLAAAALALALSPTGATAAPPRLIEGADPAIWAGQTQGGPLTHIATGAVFAEQIGTFSRFRAAAVDDGEDVFVNYEMKRAKQRIVATVYLFRPGDLPEHRLSGALAALGATSPQAFVWAGGPFAIDAPQRLQGFKGTYKTGIGPTTVMDYLYFIDLGRWRVKVRATLGDPGDIAEEQAIDAFVRSLPWASILTANGACEGPACAVGRPMPIDHHVGEMFLSTALERQADKLIREVAFTTKAGGAEWRLARLPDEIAPLFANGYGAVAATAPIYALIRRREGKTSVPRLWAHLPSEAVFGQAVKMLSDTPEECFFVPVSQAAAYATE